MNRYSLLTTLPILSCLLSTSPLFAGFTESQTNVYEFQPTTGVDKLNLSNTGSVVNIPNSIQGNTPDQPLIIDLRNSNSTDRYWINTNSTQPTINLAGKVQLLINNDVTYNGEGTNRFGVIKNKSAHINIEQGALLSAINEGNDATLIETPSGGTLYIDKLAGGLKLNSGTETSTGYARAYGIHANAADIVIQNFDQTGYIDITGAGRSVRGIYSNNKLDILGDLAGKITVNSTSSNAGYASAIHSSNSGLAIGNITETAEITVNSANWYNYGIISDHGNLSINSLAGKINVQGERNIAGIYMNDNGDYDSLGQLKIGNITDSAQIIANGTESNVHGISAYYTELFIEQGFAGNIQATGTTNVYGIYGRKLTLNNITGTIAAHATDANAKTAAIATKDAFETTANAYANDDFVQLNTNANILGDIRLGFNNTPQGDTLILGGSGSFNHNLFGIETLELVQADATDTNHTWHLNLNDSFQHSTQRNIVNQLNITHGNLHVSNNLTTNSLSLNNDSGLTFTLGEQTMNHITITANSTTLNGTLTILPEDDYTFTHGSFFKLLKGSNFTGSFDRINNTVIDQSLGFAVLNKYDSILAEVHLLGDLNLDGFVNLTDINLLTDSYLQDGSFNWTQGDFSGDFQVNDTDLQLMAHNAGMTFEQIRAHLIPEPASLLLLLAATPLLTRRRHQN
ncbi:hypothetical protein JD969_13980 [Planctomycetota bacterium]|nr:hypothetical protein JD969_13980 [Planctomycetota bacterium]